MSTPTPTGPRLTYGHLLLAGTIPLLLALVLAVVAAAVVAPATPSEVGAFPVFFAALGFLLGGRVHLLFDAPPTLAGTLEVATLPLLLVVLSALIITRLPGLRGHLRWRPAAIGAGAGIVLWLIVGIIVSAVGFELAADRGVALDATARPGVAIMAAVLVWALAWALHWFREVALAVYGVLALAAATWLVSMLLVFEELEGAAGSAVTAIGALVLSVNAALAALVWPFGTSMDALGLQRGFFSVAGDHPWLWVLPILVLALVVVWGWIAETGASLKSFLIIAGARFGAVWVGGSILLGLGSVDLTVFGDPATAAGGLQGLLDAGLSGLPFSMFLQALLLVVIASAVAYARAVNDSSQPWATLPNLDVGEADQTPAQFAASVAQAARRTARTALNTEVKGEQGQPPHAPPPAHGQPAGAAAGEPDAPPYETAPPQGQAAPPPPPPQGQAAPPPPPPQGQAAPPPPPPAHGDTAPLPPAQDETTPLPRPQDETTPLRPPQGQPAPPPPPQGQAPQPAPDQSPPAPTAEGDGAVACPSCATPGRGKFCGNCGTPLN